MRVLAFSTVMLLAARAWAQPSPSPEPVAPPPDLSAAEIEQAMRADQETQKKARPAAAAPSLIAPADPAPPPASGSWAAAGRFFQSLNPDISAIVDAAGGYYSNEGALKAGDDPGHTGFNVEEVELALQAVVDPYFRADIFLTVPNLSGLEVEEAFLTTTHLPWNFQIKAGIFRAGLGRQNAQHLHLQDFTRRPELNAALLGIDGLRAPGLEINWLVPRLPFYLLLAFSAFSVDKPDADQVLQSFGGGARYDFTYVATARAFFPLGEATSVYLGLNFAHGKTAQTSTAPNPMLPVTTSGAVPTAYDNWFDNLYGADLYLKWKPVNVASGYASLAWQTEYFMRHIPNLKLAGVDRLELEGGLYSQLVLQAARRWYFGVRGELMGLPSGDNLHREYAVGGSITWALSEFARIRLYGEGRFPQFRGLDANGAVFLQVEAAIGAHGAHPF